MNRLVRNLWLSIAITSMCSGALLAQTSVSASPTLAVAAQYDTTHVYVAPKDVDAFV